MIGPTDILQASILIVDDQAANVALLEQMLQGAGYTSITSTRDPREVCELHRKNRYDLILLDLQMPGMDGFQVMECLKEIETDGYLPVLVITAQPDHKLRALRAGAKDFVSKPFDLAEVLVRVHNMIEVRLLHLKLTIHNFARLENSQLIAGLGDWEHDFANRRLEWSEGIYRVLGLVRSECPPNAAAMEARVHPDDLALVRREKRFAAEGTRRVHFEHRIVRPDGEMRYVHQITEMILDADGGPGRESGTMQDITERKLAEQELRASEERFKLVARAISDAVWDWNIRADSLWWNDGFLTTFGFAAREVAPSFAAWTGRIHIEDRGRVIDSIHRALATGAETWSEDYRFLRKDGSHAAVQDRGFIFRGADGVGVRMVGGMRDLTEQKKIEAQSLRAQRMESIGTLAGGIAHDLNNVFAPILLAIELLKLKSDGDRRWLKILGTLEVSTCRGADLVRQVLSFARGLDGKRVVIRLRHLIEELRSIMGETFPRNITIVAEVPTDLWPVTADSSQLHQVLLNLAVNARDAMPHGGTLTLAASNVMIDRQFAGMSPESKPGPHVLLRVTDTGIGIDPAVRERIFEPFFTTKEMGKGTGLGLATVHTVVKAHGGFVHVESEVGLGTTFRVYLPADPALRSADSLQPFPASDLPRGRGELVLVVDDEPAVLDITRQTLEAFGYRVITAKDGADAVAVYAKQSDEIALVLTDMMMPVMDGAATIQVLRRINAAVSIVAVSGISSGDAIAKAGVAGVRQFLLKPFSAEVLLTRVRDAIERPAVPTAG